MEEWEKKFMPDDFDRIYQKYFKRLKESNNIKYDPSGWLNTISKASELYSFDGKISPKDIVPYYSDYYDQLSFYKDSISKLLTAWDNYKYPSDEYTLCSSVTLGSLIVLSVFAKRNIRNVFFETPAYYASINQAKSLGMNYFTIPTYRDQNFDLNINIEEIKKAGPCIIWITQPRMSLGLNQNPEAISELYSRLPENSYIVIDEAAEQLFPSRLSSLTVEKYPRIIKIRNIYKGLGINGIRLSFISHARSFQAEIQRDLENFQGAVDYFSLLNAADFGTNIERFKLMMTIANEQTTSLRKNISRVFENEFISFSKLENGYVSSVCVDLSKFEYGYRTNRENLLKYCFNHGIPIILGATMKFAYHEQREFIRLNYFKPAAEIEGAMKIISNYFD